VKLESYVGYLERLTFQQQSNDSKIAKIITICQLLKELFAFNFVLVR